MADTPAKPRKTAPDATAIRVGNDEAETTAGFGAVREQLGGLAEGAGDLVRKAATQGKDKATDALGDLSKFADEAARTLDEKVGPAYGDYARKASSAVAGFADTLQSKDIDDVVADTKAFVRKSPVLAIGAAAAVGFLLTRLVKLAASGGKDGA